MLQFCEPSYFIFSLSILRVTALEQIMVSQELQDPKGTHVHAKEGECDLGCAYASDMGHREMAAAAVGGKDLEPLETPLDNS
jgi:hypothetical protein